MTTAVDAPTRRDLRTLRAEGSDATAVALTPLSAREAVGRRTGIDRVATRSSRAPLWQAAGIVGLIALVASATLPLIANFLSLPL